MEVCYSTKRGQKCSKPTSGSGTERRERLTKQPLEVIKKQNKTKNKKRKDDHVAETRTQQEAAVCGKKLR